jgi:hypothetical protein
MAPMAGRPSKRTPERAQRLLDAVRDGNTLQAACACAGISEDVLARWRRQSAEFAESVTRAIAESEVALVATIRKASTDDWRASAWLLERRFAETWSQRARLEIDVRTRAEQLAEAYGLDAAAIVAEAERWLTNG